MNKKRSSVIARIHASSFRQSLLPFYIVNVEREATHERFMPLAV